MSSSFGYEIDKAITGLITSLETRQKIETVLRKILGKTAQTFSVRVSEIAEQAVVDFKENLSSQIEIITDDWVNGDTLEVVPSNTRLFKRHGNHKVLVVEYPPTTRTVSFYARGQHRLAFPYVVFLFWISKEENKLTNFQLAFGTKPLKSLNDTLFYPNLPNCQNGRFCMGSAEFALGAGSITEQVSRCVAVFWGSEFNDDYIDHYAKQSTNNPKFSSLEKWAESSAENPFFTLETEWFTGVTDLKSMIGPAKDVKIQFGPIINKISIEAGEKFKELLDSSVAVVEDASLEKASSIFRTHLYDMMYTACNQVVNEVSERKDLEASALLQKLEQELETNSKKEIQKEVDYSYRPPSDKIIW